MYQDAKSRKQYRGKCNQDMIDKRCDRDRVSKLDQKKVIYNNCAPHITWTILTRYDFNIIFPLFFFTLTIKKGGKNINR